MIRELLFLIKVLFTTSPSQIDDLEMKRMKHFPFSGYKYLCWCGWCIYNNDRHAEISASSYIHEYIHLLQAKDEESWVKYYLKYIWYWLTGNPIIAPGESAYFTNPYELEAYAKENDPEYLMRREPFNYCHFILSNRKEFFRKNLGDFTNKVKCIFINI